MPLLGTATKNHARITNWASTNAQVGAKFLFHNKTCGSWNYFRPFKTRVEIFRTSSKIVTRWAYWKEGSSSLWRHLFHLSIKVREELRSCNKLSCVLHTFAHDWANAGTRKNSLTMACKLEILQSPPSDVDLLIWFLI